MRSSTWAGSSKVVLSQLVMHAYSYFAAWVSLPMPANMLDAIHIMCGLLASCSQLSGSRTAADLGVLLWACQISRVTDACYLLPADMQSADLHAWLQMTNPTGTLPTRGMFHLMSGLLTSTLHGLMALATC